MELNHKIIELLEHPIREAPKGWKTIKQFCEDTGMGEKKITALLQDAVAKGIAKKGIFRSNGSRPVTHYLIPKKRK